MSLSRSFQSNTDLQYPAVKPVLDLNFTKRTIRGINPAYTFTRNSSGTYVDADGYIKTAGINQPRFDYDPVTGEYRGLLIEESRTNLCQNSDTFVPNNLSGASSPITVNEILNPDGTNINKLLTGNAGTLGTYYGNPIGNPSHNLQSIFFKNKSNCRYICLHPFPGGVSGVYFDIINGVIAGSYGNGLNTSLSEIENYGNGWYRCTVVKINSSTNFEYSISDTIISGDRPRGINQSQAYVWGTVVENGPTFPTSYISTTSSAVTRQPDQLVLNNAPISNQGTFFIESRRTTGVSISADNGTESLTLAPPVNQNTKSVLYYNTNRTLLMSSGNNTPVETNTNPPQDLNRVSIGFDRRTNGSYMNGHIKKFSYYSSPLTEDNLRALTGNNETISRNN